MLETLLTKEFMDSFWFSLSFTNRKERDCQRVFIFEMRKSFPNYFTKMVSDIPTAAASVGYDIMIINPSKTIFIEMKVLKNAKIQSSQLAFREEIKGFDFLEYHFLVWDLENKTYYLR